MIVSIWTREVFVYNELYLDHVNHNVVFLGGLNTYSGVH